MDRLPTLALALALGGCEQNDLDDVDQVRTWANAASAVGVFVHAYEPLAFADGEHAFNDPACPVTTDDGVRVTIEGGCTNRFGVLHAGTATVERRGGDRLLTLSGYGSWAEEARRATTTGTFEVREVGPSVHSFGARYVHEGGVRTTVRYDGTVVGGYEGATRWSGSGTIEREGLLAPQGTVRARTVDEVLDDAVCSGEALSGRTVLSTDEAVAVVEYDGADDCDADRSARWFVDGELRGLVDGIVCSTGGPGLSIDGSARRALLATLAVLVVALLVRRLWPTRRAARP